MSCQRMHAILCWAPLGEACRLVMLNCRRWHYVHAKVAPSHAVLFHQLPEASRQSTRYRIFTLVCQYVEKSLDLVVDLSKSATVIASRR